MIEQNASAVIEFMTNIANNNGKLCIVQNFPLDETGIKLIDANFKPKFWGLKEESVLQFDTQKEKGYVRINNEFDVPLQLSAPPTGNVMYFCDKEVAIKKVVQLNKIELDSISEIKSKIDSAHLFIEELVINNRV